MTQAPSAYNATWVLPDNAGVNYGSLGTFWAIGCDNHVYTLSPPYVPATQHPWLEMGASAVAITLFNSDNGGVLSQTPWIMTSKGALYSYSGGSTVTSVNDRFVLEPGPGGFAYSLTDHFVAVRGETLGTTLAIEGVYRWNDQKGTWDRFITTFAPSGLPVAQISHSEGYTASTGPVGPSRLWAIDTAGNIYFAAPADGAIH
jgi:hypothetical protein